MLKEGCLEGVDEVYGFHNVSMFDEGDIRVCEGGFFSGMVIVNIKIIGKGGHGSTPSIVHDPISAANAVFQAFHTISSRNIDSRENFVFSICKFNAGHATNAFPDEATMGGTIRSFNMETQEKVIARIEKISKEVASAMECRAEVNFERRYPPTVNHPTET